MNPIDIIEERRLEILELCRKYDVTRLRIFGSALRPDWDEQHSDLDFLVEYGPGRIALDPLDALVGFKMGLENILGRSVDAVDWNAVKNPYFRKYADAEAVELYAA